NYLKIQTKQNKDNTFKNKNHKKQAKPTSHHLPDAKLATYHGPVPTAYFLLPTACCAALIPMPILLLPLPDTPFQMLNLLPPLPDATFPMLNLLSLLPDATTQPQSRWPFASSRWPFHDNQRTKTSILCSGSPKTRVLNPKSAQKPRFCAREEGDWHQGERKLASGCITMAFLQITAHAPKIQMPHNQIINF
ncbi:MAG: hypothetical protein SOW22_01515, partial [Candidatus Egerieousia sp.]|nr:hypothetical protein [Candidatus Egerieousia sp.]